MKGKIPPAFLSCDTKDLSRQERKVDQTENIQAGIISHTHTLSQREHTLNDTPQVKKRLRRSRHSRRERARGTDRRYLLQWPLIFSGAVTYLLQSNNIWLMAKEVALLPWLWINLLVIWITMTWFFWKATAGQNVWISFSVFFFYPREILQSFNVSQQWIRVFLHAWGKYEKNHTVVSPGAWRQTGSRRCRGVWSATRPLLCKQIG